MDWYKVKHGDVVVQCNTLLKAEKFIKECYNRGLTWHYIATPFTTNWRGPDTCYKIHYGKIYFGKKESFVNAGLEVIWPE